MNPMKRGDGSLAWRLLRQVIHVVHHGDEQIKKQSAAVLHLVLHRAAALEGVSCSNNEREIVCSKFRVIVGCIGISKASRCQDCGALNAGLETLLLQSEFLQLLKSIFLCLAVNDSVLQDWSSRGVDNGFVGTVAVTTIFEVPAIALLVILHARIVVAFVKILEDRGEHFRVFVGKVDPLVGRLEELTVTSSLEPRRVG